MKTIYLDTETTGFYDDDELVEVAIIDDDENILMNTLVRPQYHTSWYGAEKVHGISPQDVKDAPTQAEISDQIRDIVRGCRVVIYNAPYDSKYLPELEDAASVKCCMREFVDNPWDKWCSLTEAADRIGYEFRGAHRALADALACRAVWKTID